MYGAGGSGEMMHHLLASAPASAPAQDKMQVDEQVCICFVCIMRVCVCVCLFCSFHTPLKTQVLSVCNIYSHNTILLS